MRPYHAGPHRKGKKAAERGEKMCLWQTGWFGVPAAQW